MNTTIQPLDQYENALIQCIKKHYCSEQPLTLLDLATIWAWRNACEPQYVPISHLTECMMGIVIRFDLIGYLPCDGGFEEGMTRSIMGLIIDCSPERDWAYKPLADYHGRDLTVQALAQRAYWVRLITVLVSRIALAPVDKLPGYDHDAKVGPFGGK